MTAGPHALATALKHLEAGQPRQAEQICRQILQEEPNHAGAWHLLGAVALQVGSYQAAADCIGRAIRSDPYNAAFHSNLGLACHGLGRLDDALACYVRALQIQPANADAHNNLGNVLKDQGRLDDAAASYRRALEIDPRSVHAHRNLGMTLRAQGKLDEAVACYCRLLELHPNHADTHNNLGNAFKDQGKLDDAVACYRRALEIQPDYVRAHYNLGIVLREQGKLEEAVECHRRALKIKPDFAKAHNNLGNALRLQGKLEEAIASCRRAIAIKPDYAKAHRNLGIILLLNGDMEAGWSEYEWRLGCEDAAVSPWCRPFWDGSPLQGRTIMLFAEQGWGDTIQFVRYAPLVKQRGGSVLVECPPALVRLLGTCPGIDQLVPRGSPLPPYHVAAPLVSLPAMMRTTLESIPAKIPYLEADAALVERWRAELAAVDGFKVGIAWQGNPDHPDDRWRSIPLAQFEPLARLEGVKLVSLQKGPGTDQLEVVRDRFPVVDLGPGLDEQSGAFMDSAAVLKHLDLVITSDTAIGHLAGALGVAVWVALPVVPDWRWMLDREDSPWYPTMRLFRQRKRGDWEEVFQRIAAALQEQTGSAGVAAPITVEISPGELVDKITILEIKSQRIDDPPKLSNIRVELSGLVAARDRALKRSAKLDELTARLKAVNEALWNIEDEIRQCERHQDFGPRFVELARSVYLNNDQRSALKRQINELLGSRLIEEKSYASYGERPRS